ncbi:MAG: hypothetical protein ACLQBX_17640 [Candidatus Limnocylindrales bacterium]
MPQISFGADTQDELVAMVRRWVAGLDAVDSGPAELEERPADWRTREVQEVLHRLKGVDSRRLVHEVTEAAVRGDAVPFDDGLRARYGKTNGTAFAGMVSGPNKLMRRIARRDLITWDAAAGGYRIDPADAEVILENWS